MYGKAGVLLFHLFIPAAGTCTISHGLRFLILASANTLFLVIRNLELDGPCISWSAPQMRDIFPEVSNSLDIPPGLRFVRRPLLSVLNLALARSTGLPIWSESDHTPWLESSQQVRLGTPLNKNEPERFQRLSLILRVQRRRSIGFCTFSPFLQSSAEAPSRSLHLRVPSLSLIPPSAEILPRGRLDNV